MVLVAQSVLGKDSADIGTPFQETVDLGLDAFGIVIDPFKESSELGGA